MHSKSENPTNEITMVGRIISWLFGIAVFAAGVINIFWGNDPGFGIFLVLLSFVYCLPVNDIFKKLTGVTIPKIRLLKILLAVFILWVVFGVGELFDKIELMNNDL